MPTFGYLASATASPIFSDRKSTRLNSSHLVISYAVFCLKKKKAYRELLTAVGSHYSFLAVELSLRARKCNAVELSFRLTAHREILMSPGRVVIFHSRMAT